MKNAAATIQSSTECVGSRDMAKWVGRKARRVPDFERSMVPIPVVIGRSRDGIDCHKVAMTIIRDPPQFVLIVRPACATPIRPTDGARAIKGVQGDDRTGSRVSGVG
ncbi:MULTISPECIES: hypothetical protein [Burkholderia cepacia complex]|uniref:hypothetical protein n=1 Tax=Burkholderia cepacia complex TaxID=87882 RepID=UPI0015892E81|nr:MULTISPECIES: hypothetical protein [Burkholderia cepacia complex]